MWRNPDKGSELILERFSGRLTKTKSSPKSVICGMWFFFVTFRKFKTKSMIGRKKEMDVLASACTSQKPELVAVFGRRRVEKRHALPIDRP